MTKRNESTERAGIQLVGRRGVLRLLGGVGIGTSVVNGVPTAVAAGDGESKQTATERHSDDDDGNEIPITDVPTFEQPPSVAWERLLGGRVGDIVSGIAAAYGGGFVIGAANRLTKFDADGEIEWVNDDRSNEIIEAVARIDGGYAAAIQPGTVLAVDRDGEELWRTAFTDPPDGIPYGIVSDGDTIAVVGEYFVGEDAESRRYGFVASLDEDGNRRWYTTVGEGNREVSLNDVVPADCGYAVSGNLFTEGRNRPLFLRINDEGGIETKRIYEDIQGGATSLARTPDGGFLLGGRLDMFEDTAENAGDGFLLRVDEDGTKCWYREYGDPETQGGINALEPVDGGYIFYGIGGGTSVSRVDLDGDLSWTEQYGDGGITNLAVDEEGLAFVGSRDVEDVSRGLVVRLVVDE